MEENKDWVKVFTNAKSHLVEMAKQLLESEGYETIVMNQQDSSYLFGHIFLLVKKENETECIKLIEQFKRDLDIE